MKKEKLTIKVQYSGNYPEIYKDFIEIEVEAIILEKHSEREIIIYCQNRLGLYNTETKICEVLYDTINIGK